MAESERRTGERVDALVVVQLDEQGRYGVTRDLSNKGLLLATRMPLEPGAELSVVIYAKGETIKRTARVVRVHKTPPAEEWPYRIAMELDEALPEVVLEEGTRAAATLPLKKT